MTALFKRLPPLRDLITLGQDAGDDLRIRDMKAMSATIIFGIMAVTISYFLIPGRSTFLHAFDFVALAVEIYGLTVLWLSRSVERLFWLFVPPYLALMAFFVLINGTKEGDILGFVAAPCAAVVILGPTRSIPWFLLCFAAMIVIPQIDPYLPVIALDSAVSGANPDGLLFQSPWKKPLGPVEGIAIAAVVFFIYFLFRSAYQQLDLAKQAVEVEKDKVDRLMDAVFPAAIAQRLKEDTQSVIAENHASATILFADIVDFTPLAASLPARSVVAHLNDIFSLIDRLAARHGVEKIKTIGDAYMAVAGLPEPTPDHTARMAGFALDLIDGMQALHRGPDQPFALRIGLHSGPVVAGVIGQRKPFYDVWGDSVNMAARLETHGAPGQIQIAAGVAATLSDRFTFSAPRRVDLKGIGRVSTVFLTGRRDHSHH